MSQFVSVAVNFLYTSVGLRPRIEQLRAQQDEAREPFADPELAGNRSAIRALTAKLAVERKQHQQETAELRLHSLPHTVNFSC